MTGALGAGSAQGAYYAYVTTIGSVTDNSQYSGRLYIIDARTRVAVAFIDTGNPRATHVSRDGKKLVLAVTGLDSNHNSDNRIYLDVVNTATLKDTFRVDISNQCTGAQSVVVAQWQGRDTALVNCSEGLLSVPVDQPSKNAGTLIFSPTISVPQYTNKALVLSRDGEWLYSIGTQTQNGTTTGGVSITRVADLLAGSPASFRSVTLHDDVAATQGEGVAALAEGKHTPDSSNNNDVDLFITDSITKKVYVVRFTLYNPYASEPLSNPKQVWTVWDNANNTAFTLFNPAALTVNPRTNDVYVVNRGNTDVVIQGEEYFIYNFKFQAADSVIAPYSNTDISKIQMDTGVGYPNPNGYDTPSSVHAENIQMSDDGQQILITKNRFSAQPAGGALTFLFHNSSGMWEHVTMNLSNGQYGSGNVYGSGVFVGPDCPDCYNPNNGATRITKSRPAALGPSELVALFGAWGVFAARRRWRARARA